MASKLTQIQKRIYVIREKRVMLDSDLALLYEVEVKKLNQAVKRNIKRFPADFMFRLTKNEFAEVVTNCDHLQNIKFRPTLPYVFTEQGVAMLAAVLNSQKAIDVNIQIMRAFIKLRNFVFNNGRLYEQIGELRKLLMLFYNGLYHSSFGHFQDSISLSFNMFFQSLRPYKNLIIVTILFFLSIVKNNRKFFIITYFSPFFAKYSSWTDE